MRALLFALVLPACASPSVNAKLRAMPHNVIAAIADVNATPGSTVTVEYGDTSAYGQHTPPIVVPASGTVSVPVLGLLQKSTAHLRVHAEKDGASSLTSDLPFQTGALPRDMANSLDLSKSAQGLDGYFFISLANSAARFSVDVVIDRTGRIVWYWEPKVPTGPLPPRPAHFQRMNGNFLVFDGVDNAFTERDLLGQIKHTWKNPKTANDHLDSHDFYDLGNGHALMIGWEYRDVDLSTLFPGAGVGQRDDNTIDEVDQNGNVAFHWSTFDHIGLDEVVDDPSGWTKLDPKDVEIAHMNTLEVDDDSNIVATMRGTSSVIKIDRKTGKILWRMGGKKSDFTFVDDPMGGFSLPHDTRRIRGTKEMLLVDNGNGHKPPVTRACRYAVDETGKTAKLVWSYTHDPPLFSPFAGNTRMLPNGHMVVSYGRLGTVTEIDPATKQVIWEMSTKYFALYRAIWVPTLYP